MIRQEVYCNSCDGEFTIETPTLLPVAFCPNCGSEVIPEVDDDDDEDWTDEGW